MNFFTVPTRLLFFGFIVHFVVFSFLFFSRVDLFVSSYSFCLCQHRLGMPRAVIRSVERSVPDLLGAVVHGQPNDRDVLVGGPTRDQPLHQGFLAVLGGIRHVADNNLVGVVRRLEGPPGELVQKGLLLGVVFAAIAVGVLCGFQVNVLKTHVILRGRCFGAARRRREKDYYSSGTYPAHFVVVVVRCIEQSIRRKLYSTALVNQLSMSSVVIENQD